MIKVPIVVEERDWHSDYVENVTRTVEISLSTAEEILRQLQIQIPVEKERLRVEKERKIAELEKELKTLKGGP